MCHPTDFTDLHHRASDESQTLIKPLFIILNAFCFFSLLFFSCLMFSFPVCFFSLENPNFLAQKRFIKPHCMDETVHSFQCISSMYPRDLHSQTVANSNLQGNSNLCNGFSSCLFFFLFLC